MVDFIIVGAAKSGTTFLYYTLKQHPEIFMPMLKETNFFVHDVLTFNGPGDKEHTQRKLVTSLEEYLNLFKSKKPYQKAGEASPSYLYYADIAAERIRRFNPNMKIIIILRNPIDKVFSFYNHLKRDGREKLNFLDAIKAENERIKKGWEYSWHYINSSLYAKAVKKYIDLFGRKNVYIELYEVLSQEPMKVIKDIFNFLEVNVNFKPRLAKYNVSGEPRIKMLQKFLSNDNILKDFLKRIFPRDFLSYIKHRVTELNVKKERLPVKIKEELYNRYFKNDIEELEKILGRDLSMWKF